MKDSKKTIKRDSSLHTNHRQRMKEKYMKYGLEVFSEHEIMEFLLFFVLPQVDTNEIAHQLINKGGSFTDALKLSFEELKEVPGIKDHAATFLKLIPDIVQYYCVQEAEKTVPKKLTYEDIAELCVKSFVGVKNEKVLLMCYDSKMKLLKKCIVGDGGLYSVGVDVRSIVDIVVSCGASRVVLAHNHPSSSLIPSTDDVDSTKYFANFFATVGVELIEHFIVNGNGYAGVLQFMNNKDSSYR